ncbi:toxin C-terminal domain-containing protein [Candidatus Enterococcus ikei]
MSFTGEDAFEDAINLPLNETMQDDLSDVKGAQYYKFQVSDVQKLEFYLAHSAPTTIEVYDQNHKKMIGKTWETTNHKVSGTFLPGMYYIKIASKSATKYKLLIDTVQRNENQIELVQVGMSMQVHLNGVASPELTQFFYKRFGARSLLLPGSFSVLDFMKGLVTEWTINTGGVQILDALFGTDRTGYLKDWQGKSKEYVLGLYVGDAISLVQGAVTLVGAGMFLVGGNLMGIAGAPFTGGASLTICAVSTTVTVAAAVQGSAMVISAAKNMSNGHQWDPSISKVTSKEASDAAKALGYDKINEKSHGQPVFKNKKNNPKYITPDVDSHNGGVWKGADTLEGLGSKKTRSGTYDKDLKRIGD